MFLYCCTFCSCKKSTNSNYLKTSCAPNYTSSLSASRRLSHNRLRSSINHGAISLTNIPSNAGTAASSIHRNGASPLGHTSVSSSEENTRANFERRNSCFKSTNTTKSEVAQSTGPSMASLNSPSYCFQGPLYSNLSVIPRLSNLFSSPITLNFNPSTADFPANSPEANLRNLLLQQLLTTQQQQHSQLQTSIQSTASQANSSLKCAPNDGVTNLKCAASSFATMPCIYPGQTASINSPSPLIDSCSFISDTANCCPISVGQSDDDNRMHSIHQQRQPQVRRLN